MKILGNILIAASSLFFVETAFEMYVLTLLKGRQMLFFSLAHVAPFALEMVALSGIAFVGLAIFAFSVQLMRVKEKWRTGAGYRKFMLIVLCVQVTHTVLLLTYDAWATALFSGGGI